MATSEGWIGTFLGNDWSAQVYFDTAPHNAFQDIFSADEYKYTNLLAQYGGTMAAARRPDICVRLVRNSDHFIMPLLAEAKNTSANTQYARDSVYKMFGYMADFENLWDAERMMCRPKAVLVLREGVVAADFAASLKEDVVLLSPPNLAQSLSELFNMSLAAQAVR